MLSPCPQVDETRALTHVELVQAPQQLRGTPASGTLQRPSRCGPATPGPLAVWQASQGPLAAGCRHCRPDPPLPWHALCRLTAAATGSAAVKGSPRTVRLPRLPPALQPGPLGRPSAW
jgi:hypothetical protein